MTWRSSASAATSSWTHSTPSSCGAASNRRMSMAAFGRVPLVQLERGVAGSGDAHTCSSSWWMTRRRLPALLPKKRSFDWSRNGRGCEANRGAISAVRAATPVAKRSGENHALDHGNVLHRLLPVDGPRRVALLEGEQQRHGRHVHVHVAHRDNRQR